MGNSVVDSVARLTPSLSSHSTSSTAARLRLGGGHDVGLGGLDGVAVGGLGGGGPMMDLNLADSVASAAAVSSI